MEGTGLGLHPRPEGGPRGQEVMWKGTGIGICPVLLELPGTYFMVSTLL